MSTFNTTTNTTPNFDNLLLQSLLNRLQIHPPPSSPPPTTSTTADSTLLSSSFEDFLASHLSDDDDDDETHDDKDDDDDDEAGSKKKNRLSKEETRLEKDIVKVILSGNTQTLKPNTGQAVSIGDHHVCVGFHEEDGGSGYRIWEWHGHIMLFDDDHGYTPEYIYGNYFERVVAGSKRSENKKVDVVVPEKKDDNCNLGLKELIEDCAAEGSGGTRVLHRSRNAGEPRVLNDSSEK